MGKLKDEVNNTAANESEDTTQHKLLDGEANFLRLLNIALQYHTMGQKILSGYLYQVCTSRLGYKDGVNLQFAFNFDDPSNILTVTLLPESFVREQEAESPAPPAPKA